MTLTFTQGTAASLAPWNDPAGDWATFNAAIAAMFEQVWGIVADQGSPDQPASYTAGWSTLLDPTVTTYPSFTGMFVGVQVPAGTPLAAARTLVQSEQGFGRGQGFGGTYTSGSTGGGSMVAAVQANLSGNQQVTLIERTGPGGSDPYHVLIIINPTQVISLPALTAAVNNVKPTGIQVSIVSTIGWTLAQLESSYATITLMEAAFATLNGLENDQTGH